MDADDDAPPGVPEWVVTYGDMMSLLLTFFIMLVSMSEIKQESKYREVLASLHDRLGYTAGALSAPGEEQSGTASDSTESEAGEAPVSDEGEGGTPRPTSPGPRSMLMRQPAGRPVSAGPPVRFAPGTADPVAAAELDALARGIAGKPQRVELRGFADPAVTATAAQTDADGGAGGTDGGTEAGRAAADALAYRRARRTLDELAARGVRPGRFRLRTGGTDAAADGPDAPPPDRVEVWVLDRLAPDPRAGLQ